MSSTIIYFPRMNPSYCSNVPKHLSACATWLRYTCADADYISILNLVRGGSFPIKRDGRYSFEELEPEKTMAYLLGIYYEEYYFDSLNSLIECILRNLKMRIVAPILYLKGSALDMPDTHDIEAVACGFQKDQGSIVAINPLSSEYFEVSLDAYAEFQHQTKMVMYNVPGMSKIRQMDATVIAVRAIQIYLRRFYSNRMMNFAETVGFSAWDPDRMYADAKESFDAHLHTQFAWIKEAQRYRPFLNEMERNQFDNCVVCYQKALEGF